MKFFSKRYTNLVVVLDPPSTVVQEGRPMLKGLLGKFPIGFSAEFKNGVFSTQDKDVIAAMKAHGSFGHDFIAEDEEGEPSEEVKAKEAERRELARQAANTNPQKNKKK